MSSKVPRHIKSTIKQIEWYKEQLDYVNNLPVSKLNPKLMGKREHYIREIDLLTREVENEYKTSECN